VQDGFLNAYRALGHFRRGAPFRPWLLRIVANEAKTRVRKQRRQLRIVAAAASDLPSHPDSTESSVLGADVRRRVLAAAEQLPAKHREVVFFRYLLDLSEGETADVLGVPPGTVKSRLSRALERLSEIVELAS
jgi:RNA polymerase sigma factor (sigma-70 family)